MIGFAVQSTARFVAVRAAGQIVLFDALGTAPEQSFPWSGESLAFVGEHLWLLDEGQLRCISPVDASIVAAMEVTGDVIIPARGLGAVTAVVGRPGDWSLITRREGVLGGVTLQLADELRPLAVHGRRILVTAADQAAMVDPDGAVVWKAALPKGEVLAAHVLFEGRAFFIHVRTADGEVAVVLRSRGELIHTIPVPAGVTSAIAPGRGLAVIATPELLYRVDLRYGKTLDSAVPPFEVTGLALDDDGRHAIAIGPLDARGLPHVIHTTVHELFAKPGAAASPLHIEVTEPRADSSEAAPLPAATPIEVVDAADAEPPEEPAPDIGIPDLLPLALGTPPPPPLRHASTEDTFFNPRQHLDALLDLVAARAALAIADAWNSGRLSGPGESARPFEREVNALLGSGGGYAPDRLAAAAHRLRELTALTGQRAKNSLAAGMRLPFIDLTREFKLSSVAAQILMTVMAPPLRGEIARLYSVLSNDPNRPLVDRHLIEILVAGDSSDVRDQIARELAPDAALVRHGLVRVAESPDADLFAAVTVDRVLVERVRGHRAGGLDDVAMRRTATATLSELHVSRPVLRDLVIALSEPRSPASPLRLVLRGRRGSGRHTLMAALAVRVGRDIAAIDCARLPRGPRGYVAGLRNELFRALIRGVIPVLSELDLVDPTDGEVRDGVRQVLRAHPGPIVIRASPESTIPIDPGYFNYVLPPLLEGERAVVWAEALARQQLAVADVDALAARYRLAPGEIHNVVAHVGARAAKDTREPLDSIVDEAARQHIAARLDHVAARIERVASWDQLALPEDMLDSLREFVGRARHRRTVYERWGYDRMMTTSRGLTALFYGPPGTGKSMVAGVIAKELGLDLYRVDLARVVSKWVGETEKNLSQVFDAAEDGQVLILFDEADSLFARRTDVRTANDRYANLEVNYLLQRLDTFEGIAILTSNLEGSIDQAFKRRLSLRLYFPFPDEEMRTRLWAAHVTPRTPVTGDFNFAELGHKFALSGGYIRNCVLRAAFLAAQEQRAMSQEHLLRAIHLEYRELGKLSTSSRME